jgi:hypothetical protein
MDEDFSLQLRPRCGGFLYETMTEAPSTVVSPHRTSFVLFQELPQRVVGFQFRPLPEAGVAYLPPPPVWVKPSKSTFRQDVACPLSRAEMLNLVSSNCPTSLRSLSTFALLPAAHGMLRKSLVHINAYICSTGCLRNIMHCSSSLGSANPFHNFCDVSLERASLLARDRLAANCYLI